MILRVCAGLVLALSLSGPVALLAADQYLTANQPDGISLLPPPPAAGSAEAVAELSFVRAVVHERTAAEKARAQKDSSLAFSVFQPAIGPTFDLEKLPKTDALLQKVKKEIGGIIDTSKDHF